LLARAIARAVSSLASIPGLRSALTSIERTNHLPAFHIYSDHGFPAIDMIEINPASAFTKLDLMAALGLSRAQRAMPRRIRQ
ncbi:MAG: hypothetical protein N2423_03610, partial [Novosphingobium sp.]|nr:hypothetical protein [Novosphingobium sp.]